MRRIDLLIADARQESDNNEYTDDSGIQQSEFLRWADAAQTSIATRIQNRFPNVFQKEKLVSAVIGQEEYTLPNDVFYGCRIQQIDYSHTGLTNDYYKLMEGTLPERLNSTQSRPRFVIRRSNQYLLQPPPGEAGIIRLTYQKTFPRLDIRRGTVSAVTLDTGLRQVTALTFDPSVILYAQEMSDENYICIVDRDGNIKMKAIPVSSVNETTGVVTLFSGFTYDSGETIAVGDFAVLGSYSSTHSELPVEAERFLTDYMIYRSQRKDSSEDSIPANTELDTMANEIVETFSSPSADIPYVPILDPGYGYFEGY